MPGSVSDSVLPINAIVADAIARAISDNRMSVEKANGKAYLAHVGKRYRVHLLPYQMTVRGIRQAVAENDPWPAD